MEMFQSLLISSAKSCEETKWHTKKSIYSDTPNTTKRHAGSEKVHNDKDRLTALEWLKMTTTTKSTLQKHKKQLQIHKLSVRDTKDKNDCNNWHTN